MAELMQTAFREGDLAEEATWQAVVLIPKGKGDYRGIGLVEVMWKVVAVILNRRLTSSITFPVTQPARNPWSTSWKVMEEVRRRFKITATTFHITSTRPMPR